MISRQKLIGVLEVINKKNGRFNADDQQTLAVLGTQAAIAIENSHLFQQSDLIAELVHELRTPLSSISTISYLLQRPEISEQQRANLAQTILQESQRLNELVSSFLDLARLESGRAEFHWSDVDVCSLLESCRDVLQFKANERKIEILLDLDRTVPPVKADRDKLKQVIFNLLSNAVKYNRAQGKVVIHLHQEGDNIMIAIEDDGYGIAVEDLPHVFDKFYRGATTEKLTSGTGLGLSICKKIINGHHGEISVTSTPGTGSIFTLRLPAHRESV
jgi:signal transduction histidine kinase